MPKKTYLLIGTQRGLYIGTSDLKRKAWKFRGPLINGSPIYCACADLRCKPVLFAGENSMHWGPRIYRSMDLGKTWTPSKTQPRFAKKDKTSVQAIWQIQPDHDDRPDALYAGIAPAGLFRSTDAGETWKEIKSLNKHPSRKSWSPGAGGLCLHSILVDPNDSNHLLLGISAVGVFESFDRGKSWDRANAGLPAIFKTKEPDGPPSCVHKIAFAASTDKKPNRIYQQNHMGVFRRDGKAKRWKRIENGLPSKFGFPLVAHPTDRDTAFTIPMEGDFARAPKDGKLAVYKTTNGGQQWKPFSKGLPKPAHVGILRDAFATDGLDKAGIYFGTTGGHLFSSINEGKSWDTLHTFLPKICSIRAFTL